MAPSDVSVLSKEDGWCTGRTQTHDTTILTTSTSSPGRCLERCIDQANITVCRGCEYIGEYCACLKDYVVTGSEDKDYSCWIFGTKGNLTNNLYLFVPTE